MGSQIKVDSIEGKGSCFSFSISLPYETSVPSNISEKVDIHKVLIVDDIASNSI